MPSRNVIKPDVPESFYHVYARGISKQAIFRDVNDYSYFKYLLKRYLSAKKALNKAGVTYPNYAPNIELLSYCLLNNHFHLLIYQRQQRAMSNLMRSLMTSYSRYFNLKYKRSGSPFESSYKASLIGEQQYLEHISRYIHLNPRYWKRYPYSSIGNYLETNKEEWVKTDKILSLFKSRKEYKQFMTDYEGHKLMLDAIKHNLADV